MEDFIVQAFLIRLACFVLAICVAWLVLRRLDQMAGVRFSKVIERLHENPLALALYFGLRLVAVAIIGNAFLG